MGHSFCEFPIDIRGNTSQYLQDFIAYAQMPLFFIVSGLLFSLKTDWDLFLSKKLPRLIIPYMAFSIFAMGLKMVFSSYTHSGAPSIGEAIVRLFTGGNYWFLYALFVMMTLCRLLNHKALIVISALIAICIEVAIDIQSSIINRICHYIPYFAIGLMSNDFYGNWRKMSDKKIFGFMMCGFVLYLFALYPTFHFKHSVLLSAYLIPLFGCIGYWGLGTMISRISLKTKYVTFFGKYSLQYYLNHIPIMLLCYYAVKFIALQNAYVQWLAVFVLGICISSIMLWVEMKIKPLAYLSGLPKGKKYK